jgi:DNA ligase-1
MLNSATALSGGSQRAIGGNGKLIPLTVDAVMIYAQAGSGRRKPIHRLYLCKNGSDLVPFTKHIQGYSAEFQITTWVKRNTVQRFGPFDRPRRARFEIAFEAYKPHRDINQALRCASRACFVGDKTNRWMKSTPLMI